MPDRLNPIGAEFGEMGEMGEVGPVKQPDQEIQESDAFKKQMEKKARTVNEKDRNEKKEEKQLQHEVIVEKPIVQEAKAQQETRKESILDIQKPTSSTEKKTGPVQEAPSSPKTKVIASPSSDTSADLSKGDDNLAAKLPDSPIHPAQAPEKIFQQKQVAPPPLTAPIKEPGHIDPVHIEKKTEAKVQTHASSGGGGNSSSKQRQEPSFQPLQIDKPKETHQTIPENPVPMKALEAPHKTPLLAPKDPKPLLKAPQEAPKIALPPNPPPLSQEAPEKKPMIEAPSSSNELGTSLGNKEEPVANFFGETGQVKEAAPSLDPAEKISNSAAPAPFETPFVADNRKDDIKVSKTEEEKRSDGKKIESPSESESTQQEKQEDGDRGGQKENPYLLDQMIPGTALPQPDGIPSPFQEPVGFDRLPPHILDLFDRIVGVVTVLQVQGKTETTIHLNEKQSPLLQGTTVTITTFDTAPLAYNIELKGPPQAVALLQKNVEDLKRSFKDPKKEFNFQVHDIMISLDEREEKERNF